MAPQTQGILSHKIIFLPTLWGVTEYALKAVGLGSLFAPRLGLPSTALVTLALISVWQFVGTPLMLIYASLLNIPDELVDAARVDGLGRLRTFLRPRQRAKAAGGDRPAIVQRARPVPVR